jgi:ElaB/YqjD/DUF883 family membrane-anchored ribosome-binding protein
MKDITAKKLKKDLHEVTDDLSDLAQDAGQLAGHSARLARQAVVDPVVQATRQAASQVRETTRRGQAWAETEFDRCLDFARRNPVTTAAAVALFGIVLGLALGAGSQRAGSESHSR